MLDNVSLGKFMCGRVTDEPKETCTCGRVRTVGMPCIAEIEKAIDRVCANGIDGYQACYLRLALSRYISDRHG